MWDYANELLRANLDSTIKIIVIVNPNETTCNIPKPEVPVYLSIFMLNDLIIRSEDFRLMQGVLAMYVRRKP